MYLAVPETAIVLNFQVFYKKMNFQKFYWQNPLISQIESSSDHENLIKRMFQKDMYLLKQPATPASTHRNNSLQQHSTNC